MVGMEKSPPRRRPIRLITAVSLPQKPAGSLWDVSISDGNIASINPHDGVNEGHSSEDCLHGGGALLAPSLCHPHVHLDKAFLLAHPKYAHLQIEKGTFAEAMDVTNQAKAQFENDDLEERGNRLVDESVLAGVTHMRAFVEVDPIVGLKCLIAGRAIKKSNLDARRCNIQICAFAQLPLFSGTDDGWETRRLMTDAVHGQYLADTIGSTPYVESDRNKMKKNVEWLVDLALKHDKHIDFHLDYNLDPESEPLVWHVIKTLKSKDWTQRSKRTIVLGHCTRLTLFEASEWVRLKKEIGDLPISFVGLPTSDLYMMKTESGARGTLNVPRLIKDYGFNATIGMNNIGNAFTPQGTCDPLAIANLGVGVYQAGTQRDVEILYECISTRARAAIGLAGKDHFTSSNDNVDTFNLSVQQGGLADYILFPAQTPTWTAKRTVQDAVYLYDRGLDRQVVYHGNVEA